MTASPLTVPPPSRTSANELEQFAYVASHDMAEPLRMIASYLDLLSERYSGQLDEDADDFIALAVDGAERMQAYLSDLRNYSRIGRLEEPFETLSCRELLDEVVDELDGEIRESGVDIVIGPLPYVIGEREQLTSVFGALVSNAVKFRGSDRPRLELGAVSDREGWRFTARDNGLGVAAIDEERVFGMFQRLHGHRYPGTGMGLAIARKSVERHGGRMWVEPAPGGGSIFSFVLPDSGPAE